MTREEFSQLVSTIPGHPGCYKYYGKSGVLLYVGKAKNLRKRVSSYFTKTLDNSKTIRLVALIKHIDFTITETEHDAFLLENLLIKEYQPKFNVSLKDDKSYPYVVIKKEHFPRVFLTRKVIKDGSEYLGPFTGVWRVRELLDFIRQNIPLRTCNLNLSPANIAKKKYKVCLEYHLGNCKGPCEALQTENEYGDSIRHVKNILKGHTSEVIRLFKAEMQQYATDMQFEKAEILRQKIEAFQSYQSKSTVVNPKLGNLDIVSIISDEKTAFVNYMAVANGNIIHVKTIEVEKKLDEEDDEVAALVLARMRERFQSNSTEVISQMPVETTDENIKVTIPKAGDKKNLLELSLKNAASFREEKKKREVLLLNNEQNVISILEELQTALKLSELPEYIECFDNSNFQGAYPVSAMVCFRNGLPSKKDYRHFHIRSVEGINDFASMAEVVYRRYKRLMDEEQQLPNLVVIDGGKGQLSAALESIEKLGITGRMAIVGLAKREESVFFPGDSEPLQLSYDNPAHKLIRRIRDEVHRFGITFHRDTRSKGTIKNELEEIPGIGEKTATELLQAFRSVKNIKTLTERELTKAIGASKARIVWAYFNKENQSP
jgi:excinuclease ABC subunit C